MPKNIEMSVLGSDGSYEVLYPYTIPSQVKDLLNNDTKVYIGLNEDSTPDDAFRQLFLANVLQNKSSLRIILQNQDGIRMGGVAITSEQFCDSKGNKTPSMTTNDEGIIDTFTDGETTTVNIKGYFEIANTNTSWPTPLGEQLEETWTITTRNELAVETSGQYYFTKNVKSFDVCCIGGGGGGGSGWGYEDYNNKRGGCGGGGGYMSNIFSVVANHENFYTCTIGAGGTGGNGDNDIFGKHPGEAGGTSYLSYNEVICSATGGEGGRESLTGSQTIEVARGNGNGGSADGRSGNNHINGRLATDGSGYIFNDSSYGSCGGGGGAGFSSNLGGYGEDYTQKGNPYGGVGQKEDVNNTLPNGYGGGGGGGWTSSKKCSSGQNGYQGVVYLRWTVQEVSA